MNGVNVTTEDVNMWLTVLTDDEEGAGCAASRPTILLDLAGKGGEGSPVAGIRIWNYNKSVEVRISAIL